MYMYAPTEDSSVSSKDEFFLEASGDGWEGGTW